MSFILNCAGRIVHTERIGDCFLDTVTAVGRAADCIHIDRLIVNNFLYYCTFCSFKKLLIILIGIDGNIRNLPAGYRDGNIGFTAKPCSASGIGTILKICQCTQ